MPRKITGSLVLVATLAFQAVPALADEPAASTKPRLIIRVVQPEQEPHRSSKALKTLFATYGALQVLEAGSTKAALENGAYEINPVMTPVAGHLGQSLLVKAATTSATVYAVRAMEKKSRKAAIVTMAALNAATAVIVMRNLQNANAGR